MAQKTWEVHPITQPDRELVSNVMPQDMPPDLPYNRERELQSRLNRFFVGEFALPEADYAGFLGLPSLLNLKSVLSDINNTITLKLALGLADWASEQFKLDDVARNELRRTILKSKPNSNGFDVWLGYPVAFVAEVKCNVPVNGGRKYGARQRQGIVTDINALLNGKRKASMMTSGIPKIMAFLDLPEIRAANEHLLKTDLSLSTKLIFLPPGQIPTNADYVHGVYISIGA